jgi:cbb3-type cytochrome oxidase cytochrome c subunit
VPKVDEQISYNWLFFLLAGAFGAVTLWAVYDEAYTRREWKTYQDQFFQIERTKAAEELKRASDKLTADPEYQKAIAERKAIEGRRKQNAAEIANAQHEAEQLRFDFKDKEQNYTFTKSELDETYYFWTLALHDRSPELAQWEAKKKKLTDRLAEDDKVRAAKEVVYNQKQERVNQLLETERYAKVQDQIDKLEKPRGEAQRKKETADGKSSEIQQQNLEEIGRVDRCESCHIGAARGGFEKESPSYFASHPFRRTLLALHPPEQFGCTTCHDGQGRATTKFYAHAPSKDEQPHAFEKHFWEEPLLHGPFMESNCRKCHGQEYYLRSTIACDVQLTPEERKQRGLQGDPECPGELTCAVPTAWTPGAGMPLPETLPPAADAKAGKDGEKTGETKEQPKYCVDGEGRAPLVDLAPHLSRGRRIIEEVGCFGCHPIEGYEGMGKVGPDLRHAADKLDPTWMATWIKWPKGIRPTTRMPNFFPEVLHPDEYLKTAKPQYQERSKDPEGKQPEHWQPDLQVAALISFLYKASTPYQAKVQRLPVAGNPERGKELVGQVGCLGCHTFTGYPKQVEHKNRASHFDHGPDLSNVGAKTSVEWLFSWLKDPKSYNPTSRMPSLRLSDQEAADIAVYLSTQKALTGPTKTLTAAPGIDPKDERLVEAGKNLVKYYGCYGCHAVAGFETTPGIGVELSEFGAKTIERLDFGDYITNHNSQTWEKWLYHKLRHPRVYRYERVDTRMPQFDLTDEEITDVMVVLKGMRGDEKDAHVLGHKLSGVEEMREQGRRMVRWYNCFGCHPVDNFNPDIRQIYPADQLSFAPPNINGEGIKAQPTWLFGFLKNVSKLRPWLSVRMPTFGLPDAEATQIVAMFSSIDKMEWPFRFYGDIELAGPRREIATRLFQSFKCQQCHVLGDAQLTQEQAASAAPNLLLAKNRLRAEWISKWLENPEALSPGTRMPAFFAGGGNPLDAFLKNPDGQRVFGGLPGVDAVRQGGARAQIELLRDYLMTLSGAPAAANANAGGTGKPKPAKKAEPALHRRAAAAQPMVN